MTVDEAIRLLDPKTAEQAFELVADALRAQRNSGWISAKNEMPKRDENYRKVNGEWPTFIVALKYFDSPTIAQSDGKRWFFKDGYDYTVAYWIPLPEPPKEDT